MSSYATWIASRLQTRLDSFAEPRKLGTVVDEMLFIFDAQRDIRRRPDVAFVSAARWPLDQPVPKTGDWEVVPDLAVEVISPTYAMEAVIAKLTEYFRFGVKQVCVVLPTAEQVYIYDAPDAVRVLTTADQIEGGTLLPGFRLSVAAIFSREGGNGAAAR